MNLIVSIDAILLKTVVKPKRKEKSGDMPNAFSAKNLISKWH